QWGEARNQTEDYEQRTVLLSHRPLHAVSLTLPEQVVDGRRKRGFLTNSSSSAPYARPRSPRPAQLALTRPAPSRCPALADAVSRLVKFRGGSLGPKALRVRAPRPPASPRLTTSPGGAPPRCARLRGRSRPPITSW